MNTDKRRLALFTSALDGGGVQRSMRNLATALVAAGYRVDLIVCHTEPALAEALEAAGVAVHVLKPGPPLVGRALALSADPGGWRVLGRAVLCPIKTWRKVRYLAALRDHLRARPCVGLLSAMTQCNLVAIWAHRLAGASCRLVVSERNMLSSFISRHHDQWRWRYIAPLVARTYPSADVIVGVSHAVVDDLALCTGLSAQDMTTAPNPVVDKALLAAARPRRDGWFAVDQPPVILGVGRLLAQKDPATLLAAFARVRQRRHARLVLIGDGALRPALLAQAETLGVREDIDLPGWDDAPFSSMAAAAVFVLPSRWEGLPGVLIQALACGCPVVATDCPGGSAEILENGRYGALVPIGDAPAMAEAIEAALDDPGDADARRARAGHYSAEHAAACYARLLDPAGEPGASISP